MLLPKVPPLAGLRAGHSRALGREMLITGTSQVSQVLSGSSQPCRSPREGFLQRPPAGRGALGESPCPDPRIALGMPLGHWSLVLGLCLLNFLPVGTLCTFYHQHTFVASTQNLCFTEHSGPRLWELCAHRFSSLCLFFFFLFLNAGCNLPK